MVCDAVTDSVAKKVDTAGIDGKIETMKRVFGIQGAIGLAKLVVLLPIVLKAL